ncbi:Uncharacterized protein SCF082_LOCUS24497 [Durusdinium trenchii]|uniref:Uncharacterized protein n=1 Tax=Durusdinium trenchii TaxID=1381693 RepID=A0ABP0LTQ4_9DINO
MSLLWKGPLSEERRAHLRLEIADTILFDAGRPSAWLFTAKNGRVLRKQKQHLDINEVISALGRKAQVFVGKASGPVCVTRSRVSGRKRLRVEFLHSHQLLALLRDKRRTLDLVALQLCVRRARWASYGVQFERGQSVRVFRLTDDKEIGGTRDGAQHDYEKRLRALLPSQDLQRAIYRKDQEVRILSKAHAVNQALEQRTLRIVRFVEATRSGSVVASMWSEFVCFSGADLPVLTHISSVRIQHCDANPAATSLAQGSADTARSSPEQAHEVRSVSSAQAGDPIRDESSTLQSGQDRLPPQRAQDLAQKVRNLVGQGPSLSRCWGTFCDANAGAVDKHKRNVLLLSVVQAALLGFTVESACFSQGSSSLTLGRAKPTLFAQPPSVSEIQAKFHVNASRLYASVPVCSACHRVYQQIERERTRSRQGGMDQPAERGRPSTEGMSESKAQPLSQVVRQLENEWPTSHKRVNAEHLEKKKKKTSPDWESEDEKDKKKDNTEGKTQRSLTRSQPKQRGHAAAKSHRVKELHGKLSRKLAVPDAQDGPRVVNPPLVAVRRKSFVPAQRANPGMK